MAALFTMAQILNNPDVQNHSILWNTIHSQEGTNFWFTHNLGEF